MSQHSARSAPGAGPEGTPALMPGVRAARSLVDPVQRRLARLLGVLCRSDLIALRELARTAWAHLSPRAPNASKVGM